MNNQTNEYVSESTYIVEENLVDDSVTTTSQSENTDDGKTDDILEPSIFYG